MAAVDGRDVGWRREGDESDPVAVGIALSASLGFMLPVSTPPNAIFYASGYIPITKMITDTASTIPLQVHPMIFHFITVAVSFILCIPKYNPIADTTSKIHPPAPLNGLLVPPVFMEPKSSR